MDASPDVMVIFGKTTQEEYEPIAQRLTERNPDRLPPVILRVATHRNRRSFFARARIEDKKRGQRNVPDDEQRRERYARRAVQIEHRYVEEALREISPSEVVVAILPQNAEFGTDWEWLTEQFPDACTIYQVTGANDEPYTLLKGSDLRRQSLIRA